MINLKIKTNGTVRSLTLPYPGQYIPDIIEKNSVVTVSEVTEQESLKYMEGHEWNIEEINFPANRIVYDGKYFPEYDYKGSFAIVAVASKGENEYLYLLCSIKDINHALTKLPAKT